MFPGSKNAPNSANCLELRPDMLTLLCTVKSHCEYPTNTPSTSSVFKVLSCMSINILFCLFILAKCTSSEFTCANGMCIPYDSVCNGVSNCWNGGDELICRKTHFLILYNQCMILLVAITSWMLVVKI